MKKSGGNDNVHTLLYALVIGIIAGSISAYFVVDYKLNEKPDERGLIRDFYLTENAVHVSPHSIRKSMMKGETNFILVDLRSQEEYEREHIRGAINIPAYKNPDESAYGDIERIVSAFSELPKGKDIVVYCYSIPCMTGRKIGKMLVEHGIYVKHLGIGWNEWRYHWNLWNHEHEWSTTKVDDYVWHGNEPGPAAEDLTGQACPIEGEFGC